MPPHVTPIATIPAAFAARMSNGESPTYAASAGSAPIRSAASSSGWGSGLWRSVSSPPTIVSNRCPSGTRSNASSAVERRFAVTIPSLRPSAARRTSASAIPGHASSSSWSGSLWARYTRDELVDPVRRERRHLRVEAGPADRPHQLLVAVLAAEHLTGRVPHRREDDRGRVDDVPSRSKRTTGKRHPATASYGNRRRDRAPTAARSRPRRARSRPSSSGAISSGLELEHRPDEAADHVTQIAVGGDLEVEMVAAADPLGALDDADEHLVLRLRRREGAEVVLAGEQRRSRGERCVVERARDPPAPPRLERRRRPPVEDPVAVAAGAGRMARVEVRRGRLCREHRDLVRQPRVQRLGRPLDRRPARHVDRRDLAQRVHAGIRAAGDGESVERGERRRRARRGAHPRPSTAPAGRPSRGRACRRTRSSV